MTSLHGWVEAVPTCKCAPVLPHARARQQRGATNEGVMRQAISLAILAASRQMIYLSKVTSGEAADLFGLHPFRHQCVCKEPGDEEHSNWIMRLTTANSVN